MNSTANLIDVDYATDMLIRLLAIDSVTGFEAAIGAAIVDELKKAGVPASAIRYDTAHQRIKLPTEVGNLIVDLPGTQPGPRLLFSTHMDTVPLCKGAKPRREGDRIVSDGTTALGGDNGTGCAVLIALAIGGALALFAWRAPTLKGGAAFEPVSRETTLLLNNVFLIASCACVFVGTLYPLVLEAFNGTKISVGPPYYMLTFSPIFFALLLLVPLGPKLGWKRGDLKAAWRSLYPALGLAAVAAIAVLALITPRGLTAALAFAVAGWLIGASILDVRSRKGARASAFAAALAHAGLGVTLLGVTGATAWRSEALTVMAPGEIITVGPYRLRFDGVTEVKGPNYVADQARIALMDGDRVKTMLRPEQRFYTAEGQSVADTAIRTTGLRDLYLALGDNRGNGRYAIRVYVSPLAPLIWLGALVMALGGMLSLWGRVRVGARASASETVAAE